MKPKELAEAVITRLHTADPDELCAALNIRILPSSLVDLRGFLVRMKRSNLIFIADDLDDFSRRFVLFHEIGHFLMHREVNRIFMDSRTFFKTSPYEREADQFAVCCLYPDDADLYAYIDRDIQTVSRCLGLPAELARYRMELIDYPFNLLL
ncbi:ImmA/IrrE family metallo-endopeptidase [Anaerofilum sp. BX8]|uniref:ImmA/IrrE family metallo-endopeptidase n=1 Tax=Anaerofilum hominis TaxID=2763016 RepID=A0A923I9S7_9FIRM|nr:ImmA/IrrE family metallo-endopeptidase [Anaerofilum hominis]MBC5580903.1 ImmA/IrrE family metallo-endopeptidase [Anaerofilum hominis]